MFYFDMLLLQATNIGLGGLNLTGYAFIFGFSGYRLKNVLFAFQVHFSYRRIYSNYCISPLNQIN